MEEFETELLFKIITGEATIILFLVNVIWDLIKERINPSN